jgi:dienelactone hydrolase
MSAGSIAAILVIGCVASTGISQHRFSYDASSPPAITEVSARKDAGVIIRDVHFAAHNARRGRVEAYIVSPGGEGPFSGVLYFHWLGKPKGDRTEFLDEAISRARYGSVGVLIQGRFPWTEEPTDGPADREKVIDQVVDLRRTLDLLLSQTGVDSRRVGFVGHDYGAMHGAIMAGFDKRVKAYVLIAGMGTFSEWSLKYWPPTTKSGEAAYREALAPLDPIHYVGKAAPAALLFQFSKNDHYISKEVATAFFEAASQPKEVKWYDVEHDMNIRGAQQDRHEWLTRQLNR